MDLDDATPQPARRPSAPHDRPTRAPFGPRIRTRQKNSQDVTSPGPASPSTHYSTADSPGGDTTTLSLDASLDTSFDGFPAHPPLPASTYPPPSLNAHADAAVQAPSTAPPSPLPLPEPSQSPFPSPLTPAPSKPTTAQKPVVGTFIAPPPITPPPVITFDSTPIPWKGLPLEAAQWTFSSDELQEIVSKAIRLSARESFVRLLSLQALEVDIVQESERLDSERAVAQARWRFEVGRRTMLMQALNSSAASSAPNGNGAGPYASENGNGNGSPVSGFIGQLASSIATCDTLLSSILQFQDQQSQIALIQHQHWSSALGIALRKLNRAYERQGEELKRVQTRVQTLEDELEEAWREAEKMAIEFDDFEQEVVASEPEDMLGDVNEGPEEVTGPDICTSPEEYAVSPDSVLELRQDPDETGTLGDGTLNTDVAVVLGVTATAIASKATLVTSLGSPKFNDKSDTKSIRSVKSSRSRRSTRDGPSHASRVSSARVRSRAASNASLRLPKSLRSAPSTHSSPVDAPPMPALPPAAVEGQSFLDMDNLNNEHVRKAHPPKRHPEPGFALPTTPPPHSARLPQTHVPSIWLETDGGQSTHLNGLDRTHSLQIFSSLTGRSPKRARRSNLVMSLTGSDRGSEASPVEGGNASGSCTWGTGVGRQSGGGGSASPTSNSSPVSLPTHTHAHFRDPSVFSTRSAGMPRPGSADARLTTTGDTRLTMPTPRRSLVSRASSVILRRLSQATTGGGNRAASSPSSGSLKSREVRLSTSGRPLERWKEREEGEGEVILIGSPHTELLDNL